LHIKSCLSLNGECSDYFQCHQGLRHGENVSRILFSLYLNDLENYLLSNGSPFLEINSNDLDVYLKLIVLLYADDTVVFASSEETMLQSLELFANFCDKWKLDINYDKTKVLVFGDRVNSKRNIILRNNRIEVLNEFKYLGVILNKIRKFTSMKKTCGGTSKKSTI